jgi:uncharacterized membrane protein SirB2
MQAPIPSAGRGGATQTVFIILLVLVLGAIMFLRLSGRLRRRTAYMFGAAAAVVLVVIALAIYRGGP